jgi:hypothetical protein
VSRSSGAQGCRRYIERHEDEQAIKFAIAINPVLAPEEPRFGYESKSGELDGPSMKQLDAVQIERLTEIKGQLLNLVSEALDLVRGTPEEQRANHWYATVCTALDRDNTQGNDSTITLQETIDALREHASK